MQEIKFYVYEWYNVDTNYVFYVGKGCGKRYREMSHRNEIFKEYCMENNVDSRIVKDNLTEQEAFAYETELTYFYKDKGECHCSLATPGIGGHSAVWTDEMREYWSKYNPMKSNEQRERMSKYNPMKNPDVAKRVGAKHKRAVIIDGIKYDGAIDAAKVYGVSQSLIGVWCKEGGNSRGQICHYADEKPKPYVKKTGNSKPVLIDGIWYKSISAAANAFNFPTSSLTKLLREGNGIATYNRHKCEYANQQPSQENSNNSILEGSTTNE